MKPVLIDTGCIVALLDRSERRHRDCLSIIEQVGVPLVTCEAVIAESCHLLRKLPGAKEAVLENVERAVIQVPFRLAPTARPVRALMRKYRRVPMDLADACLVEMADQLDTGRILTLDTDFEIYRWRKTHNFENLLDEVD